MKETLLYLWQLPQNICGYLYTKYLKIFKTSYPVSSKRAKKFGVEVNTQPYGGGVSLGKYIIINEDYLLNKVNMNTVIKHECGHCIQSKILGPLYLLVIGLPSIIWATMHTYIPYFNKFNYYSFYTEKWANKLSK